MSSYRITRESLATAGACWLNDDKAELGRDREAIEVLIPPEGTEVSVAAVKAALDAGVSPDDVHWALTYAAGLPNRVLRLAACADARRALALVSSSDQRSVAAVDVAERYARGEASRDELNDALFASCDAASAAVRVLDAAKASDATNAAACAAATSAADATRTVYSAAKWGTARNASWRESCLTLARIVENEEL